MQPNVAAVINELLDETQEEKGEFDFVNDFAAYVQVSVTAEVLGVDAVPGRGDVKRWTVDKAPSRSILPAEELESFTPPGEVGSTIRRVGRRPARSQ